MVNRELYDRCTGRSPSPSWGALFSRAAHLYAIDICINNGIIGVQEGNAYAETKGKR
jgi:hypothetical protein